MFLTMPIEQMSFDIPQQIEYLWGLKSAITFSDIVPVIVSLLETPLENLEKYDVSCLENLCVIVPLDAYLWLFLTRIFVIFIRN